jgi:hypothetical protein
MADSGQQRRQAIAMNDAAAVGWAEAMRAHIFAPPDAGFASRLRGLAEAGRARARAARVADAAGLRWVAQPAAVNSQPPYELRPGSGRVGPGELWERFDACAAAYSRAVAGTSAAAVADAADQLAEVAAAIADAVDEERGVAPPDRKRGRRSRAAG